MSVVFGIGASHTTLMNTNWDAVAHLDRAIAFRQGLADASDRLRAARP
jgi:2,3-dihydroxyphenylpropionate 1,2-dioxygenase